MATKQVITIESDLSGAEGAETIVFMWGDGRTREIDLTPEERVQFETTMSKIVVASRLVDSGRGSGKGFTRGSNVTPSGIDSKVVRAWGVQAGLMETDTRGRIPADVIKAWTNRSTISPPSAATVKPSEPAVRTEKVETATKAQAPKSEPAVKPVAASTAKTRTRKTAAAKP